MYVYIVLEAYDASEMQGNASSPQDQKGRGGLRKRNGGKKMSETTHTIMGYGNFAVASNNSVVIEFDSEGNESVEFQGMQL